MKILHVAQILQGGVGAYLTEVVPAQVAALGADNVVMLAAADQRAYFPDAPPGIFRTFPSSRRSPRDLLRFARAARLAILRERPDIVHLHSSFAGMAVRSMPLPAPRSKIVYCAHGWSFNMRVAAWKRAAYARIERLLTPASDAIICISHAERRDALARGLRADRLVTIHNGVRADPGPVPDRSALMDPACLNLLFIGRLDTQKGFAVLHAAMRRLSGRPIHLHCVGAAVVSGDAALPPLPNITHHGWQAREAVPGFIAAVDAVVVPSLWEGFGLAAAEAMRQGRPVIASAVDGLPELVRDGVSGYLVPPGDVDALTDRLAGLDRATLRRLGPTAQALFRDRFTAERMNARILALYVALLADTPFRDDADG
ncbi:glycosyltransferase [Sphingomonas arantia]|uniref:Glycosyltransferase n=1 Tax=Sphingomonas arantia TaxID=1460676 RepID=A0ABW4TVL8_9SPHN